MEIDRGENFTLGYLLELHVNEYREQTRTLTLTPTPTLTLTKVNADGTSEWISGINADLNGPKVNKEKLTLTPNPNPKP